MMASRCVFWLSRWISVLGSRADQSSWEVCSLATSWQTPRMVSAYVGEAETLAGYGGGELIGWREALGQMNLPWVQE